MHSIRDPLKTQRWNLGCTWHYIAGTVEFENTNDNSCTLRQTHAKNAVEGGRRNRSTEQGMNMKSCILHGNLHSLSNGCRGSETLKMPVDLYRVVERSQAGFLGMLAANC
ncbi:hypothetical protein ALC60_12602 [Trachymyrmex zeteki]|uniref:Uncharacterized protein n=1 Tax=Mycetomoellerius zeteki TaxID=64791 RepID=A0A151WKB0_9HYME|nr:hypothetical protein ALC60_12602 [Trachymyrmex zeteki]